MKNIFERSRKWLENKYGKNNLISTSIHRDETTPHLVAYVVPIDEITGNLNAKNLLAVLGMFFQRCRRILLKLLVIWDLIGGVKNRLQSTIQ